MELIKVQQESLIKSTTSAINHYSTQIKNNKKKNEKKLEEFSETSTDEIQKILDEATQWNMQEDHIIDISESNYKNLMARIKLLTVDENSSIEFSNSYSENSIIHFENDKSHIESYYKYWYQNKKDSMEDDHLDPLKTNELLKLIDPLNEKMINDADIEISDFDQVQPNDDIMMDIETTSVDRAHFMFDENNSQKNHDDLNEEMDLLDFEISSSDDDISEALERQDLSNEIEVVDKNDLVQSEPKKDYTIDLYKYSFPPSSKPSKRTKTLKYKKMESLLKESYFDQEYCLKNSIILESPNIHFEEKCLDFHDESFWKSNDLFSYFLSKSDKTSIIEYANIHFQEIDGEVETFKIEDSCLKFKQNIEQIEEEYETSIIDPFVYSGDNIREESTFAEDLLFEQDSPNCSYEGSELFSIQSIIPPIKKRKLDKTYTDEFKALIQLNKESNVLDRSVYTMDKLVGFISEGIEKGKIKRLSDIKLNTEMFDARVNTQRILVCLVHLIDRHNALSSGIEVSDCNKDIYIKSLEGIQLKLEKDNRGDILVVKNEE